MRDGFVPLFHRLNRQDMATRLLRDALIVYRSHLRVARTSLAQSVEGDSPLPAYTTAHSTPTSLPNCARRTASRKGVVLRFNRWSAELNAHLQTHLSQRTNAVPGRAKPTFEVT